MLNKGQSHARGFGRLSNYIIEERHEFYIVNLTHQKLQRFNCLADVCKHGNVSVYFAEAVS